MRGDRDLQERLKAYALSIIKLYGELPKKTETQVIGRQFLRSGTSPGAQHREANRARSKAEFISKMESALQELDETDYWLDLLKTSALFASPLVDALLDETGQLMAIFTTIIKNAKNNS